MKKVYELKIDLDDELSGIESVSLVDEGAIGVEFLAFNKEKKPISFKIENEEKRIVTGPSLIPNIEIYRLDKLGNEYYVFFSKDTVRDIVTKYMKNGFNTRNDVQHNGKLNEKLFMIESWIIEDDTYDKSRKFDEFKTLPIGTWMTTIKVLDDDTWNKVKEGKLKGFSVAGMFIEEQVKFQREQEFLEELSKLLEEFKSNN